MYDISHWMPVRMQKHIQIDIIPGRNFIITYIWSHKQDVNMANVYDRC